jgi:sulfhydrogenase subunit beta (sulfur reductase)
VIGSEGLEQLIGALHGAGYEVLGPTVRNRAIVIEPIDSAADLPRGWGDAQEGGTYRLVERGDGAYFGFAAPAGTWKRHLFPPRTVLWRAVRDGERLRLEESFESLPPRALLGIRGCDLAAIAVQDRVFVHAQHPDPVYTSRRAGLFLVGVNCSDPAATCFCTSMGTGPAAGPGADLVLTELDPGEADRHRFLVDVLSDRGADIAAQLAHVPVSAEDVDAAARVTDEAARRMQRSMNTESLPQLLAAAREHPRWDDVAQRCLACGNCTMQCPTCFCSDVADEPDVVKGVDERVRHWASCFELGYSYIHGGSVRVSTKSRYRQWLTHKLGTWWEQFDTSGCVGCGRCITWCPVGIDITEEVRALREDGGAPGGEQLT